MSADAKAERKTETIPEWKREEVDEIVSFLEDYASIGVVDVTGIPSRQLQNMRRDLHGTAALRISRNTLMIRAIDEVDEGLEQLVEHVEGQVGLIGTNTNPFGLYRELEASKTPAPINAGEVAPNEIVIPEGDTGVDPGPFVGDLQSVGANARIDEGSIKVVEDSKVLDAGEEVSADLANVLNELGIEPKEVGLDLRAVYSEGVLFAPEELDIDVEDYRADVEAAAAAARNLSVNAVYPTTRTAPALLGRAAGEAKSVGVHAAVESPDLVDDLLGQADAQVRSLAAVIDDEEALPEELRDVDATSPAPTPDESETDDEESTEETDEESDAEDDTDDEEEGGAALGDMFG
ncbi:MAG: 50S ribosomal protein L10 [Natronomonas sp.]